MRGSFSTQCCCVTTCWAPGPMILTSPSGQPSSHNTTAASCLLKLNAAQMCCLFGKIAWHCLATSGVRLWSAAPSCPRASGRARVARLHKRRNAAAFNTKTLCCPKAIALQALPAAKLLTDAIGAGQALSCYEDCPILRSDLPIRSQSYAKLWNIFPNSCNI